MTSLSSMLLSQEMHENYPNSMDGSMDEGAKLLEEADPNNADPTTV